MQETISEEDSDGWYLQKLNAGLAHLQNVDYVLAWVSMEDDGVRFGNDHVVGARVCFTHLVHL